MKLIGLIGGLGPEATMDYYREIIAKFATIFKDKDFFNPEILICSVNMAIFLGFLESKEYNKATSYLVSCIKRLEDGGADFAALTANTPHLLFDEIQAKVNLPLISIVESCAKRAKEAGAKRCALFGTKFTMSNSFYHNTFSNYGIEVISPDEYQTSIINAKLFTELELGIFKNDTRLQLLEIASEMVKNQSVDSVILGCTEFPIMFTEQRYLNIPFLNTSKIHVDEIVRQCMDEK